MALNEMTENVEVVQTLSDYPNQEEGLSAEELKAKFDQGSKMLKEYINGQLVPAVQGIQNALDAGVQYGLDTTLSVPGRAADAAAVGTALAGKAPAGYGFGGNATTDDEFMAIVDRCLAEMPGDSIQHVSIMQGGRHSVTIRKHLDGYADIEDISYALAVGFGAYYFKRVRSLYGGNWNSWEWENPPMQPGAEYRTTERWNGMPLYKKFVNFGALPNNTFKAHAVSTENVTIVKVNAMSYNDSGTLYVTLPYEAEGIHFWCYATSNSVVVFTNCDATNYIGYAEVWYTKN